MYSLPQTKLECLLWWWVAEGRLDVLTGDLGKDKFGLGEEEWAHVAAEADLIVHNGALVSVLSL